MCLRNTVVDVELLPPILEAFAQCPFSLHATRNVDVFSLCAVVEGSINSSPVVTSTASSARTVPATPAPAGIIFLPACWLETSESDYAVTRRRHYAARPLRKPQNSRIHLFVRLRDPFLFSGDCSRRMKLNCHSTVYLEVVINQSSLHD
jgi:hypothetical protein